jgi:xanthine dehydrogenase YagT iron-sulfur-binding subunit
MTDSTLAGAPVRAAALPSMHAIRLRVNGQDVQQEIPAWVSLLDLLRERLHLTGTKKGCDHGQCGACTVLVDGKRINSCLALAVMHDGAEVTTVEGLAALGGAPVHVHGTATATGAASGQSGTEGLHPLQAAFVEHDAFQCGYCTPGQLCSAAGLMNEHPPANRCELRERMSGNLCRCGAYPQIVQAVSQVIGLPS